MDSYYLTDYRDDRNHLSEMRAERKAELAPLRMEPLLVIIESCKHGGDGSFRPAFNFWIIAISERGMKFDRSVPRTIKIPDALRVARGLATQDVLLLPNDELWSLVGGQKDVLLYSPS